MSKQTNVPMEISGPMTISPEGSGASDKTLCGDSLLDSTVGEQPTPTTGPIFCHSRDYDVTPILRR
jgi:hypothetical protein